MQVVRIMLNGGAGAGVCGPIGGVSFSMLSMKKRLCINKERTESHDTQSGLQQCIYASWSYIVPVHAYSVSYIIGDQNSPLEDPGGLRTQTEAGTGTVRKICLTDS